MKMRRYWGLTKRNLLIYFKDKQAVFFSMLTPIIVFILYLLFLKNSYVAPIMDAAAALSDFIDGKDIDMFVSGLLLTSLLGTSMITVPYQSLITIVRDKENKIDSDICSTPMSRVEIILAYFTASAISAFFMTAVVMSLGLIIMSCQGNTYLGVLDVLRLYGITLLGTVSSTSLFMIIILFLKTTTATGAFMGILCAATGFITGAYIPLSTFSPTVQTVCNLFPGNGLTVLYRNGILNPILDHIDEGIGGIDEGAFAQTIRDLFVFTSNLFGKEVGVQGITLGVIVIAIITTIAISIIYPKVYQKK